MTIMLDFMRTFHGTCDQLYADGEASLLDGPVDKGMEQMNTFKKHM